MIRQVTNVPMYSDDQLRAACAKATADERERCARLAEQRVVTPTGWFAGGLTSPGWETRNALRQLAKRIRQQS
jgi:hypothetical protein